MQPYELMMVLFSWVPSLELVWVLNALDGVITGKGAPSELLDWGGTLGTAGVVFGGVGDVYILD